MRYRGERASWEGRAARATAVIGLAVLAAACGGRAPARENAPGGAPTAAAESGHGGDHAGGQGTVVFVQPKDGATVTSPVHFEFRAEHFQIAAVPQGMVEQARVGMGHFHLGVETTCLPAGASIPSGTPGWVHLGRGDSRVDMQLAPGPHRFSVQVGDDLHTAVDGLCQTITLTVR